MSNVKKVNTPTPAESAVIEKLRRAEKRRIQRLADIRAVYGYRAKGCDVICDNLLLLPEADREAHKFYLAHLMAQLPADTIDKMGDLAIVRLGTYDVRKLNFVKSPEVVLFKVCDYKEILKND